MARTLFLDANIFLDFYRFSRDDINEMSKLITLVDQGEITIITNKQLNNEIARNREKIIAKSLGDFKGQKFSIKAPHFCQDSEHLIELNAQLSKANTSHQNLLTELQEKISTKTLNTDQLIASLLEKSTSLEIQEQLVHAAQSRVSRQHPPGKQGSIGDAIHWESLLQHADITRINIVTGDADFASDLNTDKIRDVLEAEWKETKGILSSVSLFKSISSFFKKHYPNIDLSDEIVKKSLIDQLEGSESFSATHTVVTTLNMFT